MRAFQAWRVYHDICQRQEVKRMRAEWLSGRPVEKQLSKAFGLFNVWEVPAILEMHDLRLRYAFV